MKNWQIFGVFTFLIIGTILISGCTQDNNKYCSDNFPGSHYDPSTKLCEHYPASTPAQQISYTNYQNLRIGESVVLTSNGESVSVKVINIGSTSYSSHQVQVEIKNVGNKAVEGNSVLEVWITDWAEVIHRSSSLGTITTSIWSHNRASMYDPYPFYPGDATTEYYNFNLGDKALKGKLTFYYKFRDQTASWIIKSQ